MLLSYFVIVKTTKRKISNLKNDSKKFNARLKYALKSEKPFLKYASCKVGTYFKLFGIFVHFWVVLISIPAFIFLEPKFYNYFFLIIFLSKKIIVFVENLLPYKVHFS